MHEQKNWKGKFNLKCLVATGSWVKIRFDSVQSPWTHTWREAISIFQIHFEYITTLPSHTKEKKWGKSPYYMFIILVWKELKVYMIFYLKWYCSPHSKLTLFSGNEKKSYLFITKRECQIRQKILWGEN